MFLRWLTTVFSQNYSVRDARANLATQDLLRIQKSREPNKENPEINQYENPRKKKFAFFKAFQEIML